MGKRELKEKENIALRHWPQGRDPQPPGGVGGEEGSLVVVFSQGPPSLPPSSCEKAGKDLRCQGHTEEGMQATVTVSADEADATTAGRVGPWPAA